MTQTPTLAQPGPLPLLYDQDILRDFLKESEGSVLNKEGLHVPYLDSSGHATIGYGSTYYPDGKPVTMDDAPIDEATASGYLDDYVSKTEGTLRNIPAIQRLNPNQQAAIMSFAYNLGNNFYGDMENFGIITRAINSGNSQRITEALKLYVHDANGRNEGLVNRRNAEINLFKTPYVPPTIEELREQAKTAKPDPNRYEY